MNRIELILQEIKNRIPPQILYRAFVTDVGLGLLNTSLDFRIKSVIIDTRLRTDLDLTGGEVTYIDMSFCRQATVGNGVRVDIPYELTGGRVITAVLSANYGLTYENLSGPTVASSASISPTSNITKLHWLNDNSLYIEGLRGVNLTFLKCLLSNDSNLININMRYMKYLGKLATLATKAYIYNTMSLNLANAVVVEGEAIGAIAAKVDSYADAQELYDTELKLWKSISIMNDERTASDYHRLITP